MNYVLYIRKIDRITKKHEHKRETKRHNTKQAKRHNMERFCTNMCRSMGEYHEKRWQDELLVQVCGID